ncbi:hypothetical protein F2Q69_00042039 [Brassica cretica]|uniref:EF-hand domain-containing protein n=1 Tax=Brassica cretica TaxID=69181 RepID=A0A8S9NEU6_BRACR|nr:hypothetical protein F2Q69_00042039 [Brassica cretica]
MAKNLSEEEIKDLKTTFNNINTDKSGTVTPEELKRGLTTLGSKVSETEVKQLIEANPGPQGKLWFPDFPLIMEIDGANFDSHSLTLEGGGLRITLTHSHKTLDQNDVWKYERQNRSCNNAGKTTPAATSPIANTYANTVVLEKNRKPSHDFSPQEVLRNELAISLSKHKVKG